MPRRAPAQNLFFAPPTFPGTGQAVTADLNGDGKADLVFADGTILLGNVGGGSSNNGGSSGTPPGTYKIIVSGSVGSAPISQLTALIGHWP